MNTKNETFNPFLFYSNQLQALLVKASSQANPALWLYQNNARTPLFMLEALTRLHDKAFDEKLFAKWNARFKKLEDELGALDYFMVYEKEFKNNKQVSVKVLKYFNASSAMVLDGLNKRLKTKDWFNGKLLRFNVKISKYAFICDDDYAKEITFTLSEELNQIKEFALKLNYSFSQMEEEVHEMRRKLRWISIYAQAFNGLIQLKTSSKKQAYGINYLTKEVLASPYNKLPTKPKNATIIELDKNSFLALSWIINEFGNLKDKGLAIEALTNAIENTEQLSAEDSRKKALKILQLKDNTEATILKDSSNTLYQFLVKDKVLDALIVN